MKQWMIAGLLVVMMLSGCFGDAEADDHGDHGDNGEGLGDSDASSDGNGTADGDGNGTADGDGNATEGANEPPTVNFTSDGNLGTAPYTVNFTLNGTDPDNDTLQWTLDVDGDNETEADGSSDVFPHTYSHTYTQPGEYRAHLFVSDGQDNVSAYVTIIVEEPSEEGEEEEPQYEDRGEYLYEYATGHCHAKSYFQDLDMGPVYVTTIGGGTWVFTETNLVDGLQYEDNHPLTGQGHGFELPVEEDCVDGDLTAV